MGIYLLPTDFREQFGVPDMSPDLFIGAGAAGLLLFAWARWWPEKKPKQPAEPAALDKWNALILSEIEERQKDTWLTYREAMIILLFDSEWAAWSQEEAESLGVDINDFALNCFARIELEAPDIMRNSRFNELLFRAWVEKEAAASSQRK